MRWHHRANYIVLLCQQERAQGKACARLRRNGIFCRLRTVSSALLQFLSASRSYSLVISIYLQLLFLIFCASLSLWFCLVAAMNFLQCVPLIPVNNACIRLSTNEPPFSLVMLQYLSTGESQTQQASSLDVAVLPDLIASVTPVAYLLHVMTHDCDCMPLPPPLY